MFAGICDGGCVGAGVVVVVVTCVVAGGVVVGASVVFESVDPVALGVVDCDEAKDTK